MWTNCNTGVFHIFLWHQTWITHTAPCSNSVRYMVLQDFSPFLLDSKCTNAKRYLSCGGIVLLNSCPYCIWQQVPESLRSLLNLNSTASSLVVQRTFEWSSSHLKIGKIDQFPYFSYMTTTPRHILRHCAAVHSRFAGVFPPSAIHSALTESLKTPLHST